MIAAVASSFVTNIQASPTIPAEAKSQAQIELAGGVPFFSDADLETALDEAAWPCRRAEAALDAYKALGSTASTRTHDPGRARADRPLLHTAHPVDPARRTTRPHERDSSASHPGANRLAGEPVRSHRGASPERVMRRRRDSEIVRLHGRSGRSPP